MLKVNKLTHKLLSENLALDDFNAMLEEANHNVVSNIHYKIYSYLGWFLLSAFWYPPLFIYILLPIIIYEIVLYTNISGCSIWKNNVATFLGAKLRLLAELLLQRSNKQVSTYC